MTLANEIRKQVASYADGDLSIEAFRSWFVPFLRDVQTFDDETKKLVHAVQWEFSDFAHGAYTSESVLKENLRQLLDSAALTKSTGLETAQIVIETYLPVAQPKISSTEQVGAIQTFSVFARSSAGNMSTPAMSNSESSSQSSFEVRATSALA